MRDNGDWMGNMPHDSFKYSSYERESSEYHTPDSIRRKFELQRKLEKEIGVIMVTFLLTILAFFFMSEFFRWLYGFKHQLTIKIALAASLLLCSFLLFLFKRKLQYLYGISEMTFGIVSGWFIFSEFFKPDAPIPYMQIIAAAYIIVRGLSRY